MSLTQYQNLDELNDISQPARGQIFTDSDLDLLIYRINNVEMPSGMDDIALEMHVYTPAPSNQYISSAYDVRDIRDQDATLDIQLVNILAELNIRRGQFKLIFNYIRNVIGDYYNRDIWAVEISPDRNEIHIRAVEYKDRPQIIFTDELIAELNDINKRFALNFGENRLYRIINAKGNVDNLYLKIYGTFDDDIDEKLKLYLVEELIEPYIDNVNLLPAAEPSTLNTLRGPNWEIETEYNTITETDFKNWNDLLDTNLTTSQQIIDNYFSGSLQGADLNIDFTSFSNFVHYSSARERLLNFRYKLQLAEYYNSQINSFNTAVGSDSGSLVGNIAINQQRRDNIIGSFDLFERWLYNEPTSSLFTHGISGSVIYAEPYTLTPWPKYLSSGSYIVHHTTSSIALNWYNGFIESASLYDESNESALVKTIPEHIRLDANNDQYTLFVNMIGQHFDILWTYVNELSKLYSREEHPKLGVSSDLLKPIAESLGWKLANGRQSDELWKYKLGLNNSGSYQSTGSLFSKTGEDYTHEIWRRIVNNLPYLLKTKGTARSIKALMNVYGIPQTLLSIREYGGPALPNDQPALIEDRSVYAFDTNGLTGTIPGVNIQPRINMSWQRVRRRTSTDPTDDVSPAVQFLGPKLTGWDAHPQTIEFRFRSNRLPVARRQYLMGFTDSDHPESGWVVAIEPTSSYTENGVSGSQDHARITFYITGSGGLVSASTGYGPVQDGDFWNFKISTSQTGSDTYNSGDLTYSASAVPNNQIWTIKCQKAANHAIGRITHRLSASIDMSTHPQMQGANSSSYNQNWIGAGPLAPGVSTIKIGDGATASDFLAGSGINTTNPSGTRLSGSVQELRLWLEDLSDTVFDLHTLNPTSYVGNTTSSAFERLIGHWPLGSDGNIYDHSLFGTTTHSIASSHPDQTIQFYGYSQSIDPFGNSNYSPSFPARVNIIWNQTGSAVWYSNYNETYYIDAPSLGGNNFRSQKIRLDDNELLYVLSPTNTAQRSRYETAPVDSERLGLFYSAADQQNKEIFNQIGPIELDSYIGDPNDEFESSYPALARYSDEYWKKYRGTSLTTWAEYATWLPYWYNQLNFSGSFKNNINDYIRAFSLYDFTLFDQIKQLLPARVIPTMGLLVEPNILERPKVQLYRRPSIETPQYNALITEQQPTSSGEYILYSASIDNVQQLSMQSVYNISSSGYTDIPGNFAAVVSGSDPYEPMSYTKTEALYNNPFGYVNITSSISPTGSIIDTARLSYVFSRVVYNYQPTGSDPNAWIQAYNIENSLYVSRSLATGSYMDDFFTQTENLYFEGCRITSADINVNSTQTPDQSPVVTIFETNPNQIIYSNNARNSNLKIR